MRLFNFQKCRWSVSSPNFSLNLSPETGKLLLRHCFSCSLCPSSNLLDLTAYLRHIYLEHVQFGDCFALQPVDSSQFAYISASRRFLCRSCRFETDIIDCFMEHLRCHLSVRPYSCRRCSQNFANFNLFHTHVLCEWKSIFLRNGTLTK